MKSFTTFSSRLAAVLAVSVGLSVGMAVCHAQQRDNNDPGAEVLTRGPVHEAFAGIVSFDPEPGIMVPKSPPDPIEEMPPDERPEGNNVAWIPGYWGWDDERRDFLWISGTWRALPPGREWIAGYWGKTRDGFQWVSGYWADTTVRETVYLPAPPVTVEAGPNMAAPGPDYAWTPGVWVWYQSRYAWRPGYWAQGRADWDWTPAHYVWTPRGYIFVGGFWDYSIARRGVLFAPVYFESGFYARRGYHYSPTIAINLGVFSDHLFVRPRYEHYYFGDYYAPSYSQVGFFAAFSFQTSHTFYDPIYSHLRWEHRQDRDWEQRTVAAFDYRRDHEIARPPRTWSAQITINPTTPINIQNRLIIASPLSQLAHATENPVRFQPVVRQERQQITQRGVEVQRSRDQRQTLEAKVTEAPRRQGLAVQPVTVQLPRSPIVAKPPSQLGRNQAPPKVPQAPKPDPKFQPRPEPIVRQPGPDRDNRRNETTQPQPEAVRPGPGPRPTQERNESVRVTPQVQPEPQRRNVEPPKVIQPEPQRRNEEPVRPVQPEPQRRNVEPPKPVQPEPPRRDVEPPKPILPEPSRDVRVLPAPAQRAPERPAVRPVPADNQKGGARLLNPPPRNVPPPPTRQPADKDKDNEKDKDKDPKGDNNNGRRGR